MGMLSEFKEFAIKGNVMDMAVGIVIGAAFGKIVSSFVDDVLMPPVGLLLGGTDFTQLSTVLKEGVGDEPDVVLAWGAFIQTTIDFLIIAFAIFMVVRVMNRLQKKEEEKAEQKEKQEKPKLPNNEVLLMEIRDLLKQKPL